MDSGQVDTITRLADAFKAGGPFLFSILLLAAWLWTIAKAVELYKDRGGAKGLRAAVLGFAAVFLVGSLVVGWRAIDWWLETQDVPFGRYATIVRVPNDITVWSDATHLYQQKVESQRTPTHSIRLAFLFKSQCPDDDVLILQMNREGMKKPDTFRISCKALDSQWQTRRTFDLDVDDNGALVLKHLDTPAAAAVKARLVDIVPSANAAGLPAIPSATQRTYEAARDISEVVEAAQVLQSPRVPPGAKLEALGRLQASSALLRTVAGGEALNRELAEPLYATLLDMQRHSDRQLAKKAQILLGDLPLVDDMARLHASPAGRRQLAAIVESMSQQDLARARESAQAGGHSALATSLAARTTQKLAPPIPTYTKDGDRFFVRANWENSDEKAVQCIGKAYHDHWGGASLRQQTELVRTRTTRTVYYTKDWARDMLRMLQACGADAAYIAGPVYVGAPADAPEAPLKALK